MSECLQAAIISGIIGAISLSAALFCTYLTYKLAMATLMKQKDSETKDS
jgi:hypothetical protein